ncbi:argininosuccinate lyase [Neobacillus niacini]|nr:argininosuccinate lyase [Neobacillus niacini]
MSDFSIIMMHLSRLSEELILWSSQEFKFITIDDAYSTGSSIMPQKKNPDAAELIRGKTGQVYGSLTSLLTTMKGLPLTYNKDMQEDKEPFFDSLDTVLSCLQIMSHMISTMKMNSENMKKAVKDGFLNATEVADYLVSKGVAFRDAHSIVGLIPIYCEDHHKAIGESVLFYLCSYIIRF